MRCPHCSTPLRLVEDVPASLLDSVLVVSCPVKSCRKDIVAAVRWSDAFELELLTSSAARKRAYAHVVRAQRADLVFPIVAMVGTVGLTLFLAAWQVASPSPPPANNALGIVAICAGGAVVVLGFGAAIMLDIWLGVRGWQRALRRPLLNLMALPQTYR